MILKKTFRVPGWWVGFYCKLAFKRREGSKVAGITNKIGARYVLFLDYDIKRLRFVIDEVTDLQDRHKLGNAYYFATGRGFHVIIPDLFTYSEVCSLLEEASIERAYRSVPKFDSKVWVLRFTSKKSGSPQYLGVTTGKGRRLKSAPHLRFLRRRGAPKKLIESQLLNSSYKSKGLCYATYEA